MRRLDYCSRPGDGKNLNSEVVSALVAAGLKVLDSGDSWEAGEDRRNPLISPYYGVLQFAGGFTAVFLRHELCWGARLSEQPDIDLARQLKAAGGSWVAVNGMPDPAPPQEGAPNDRWLLLPRGEALRAFAAVLKQHCGEQVMLIRWDLVAPLLSLPR